MAKLEQLRTSEDGYRLKRWSLRVTNEEMKALHFVVKFFMNYNFDKQLEGLPNYKKAAKRISNALDKRSNEFFS